MKLKKVAIFSYSGQNTVSKTPYCRESAATKAAKKDLADKKAEGSFYHSDRTYADRRAAQRKRDSEYVASERQKRELMQKMTLEKSIDQKAQRQLLDQKEIFSNYKPTLYSSEVASLKQIVKDRFVGLQTYQGKISPGGQCLPGIQRFFVTVDGKFFPCERVDEESSELCIGDLKNGFDLENAKKILNVAKITEKECRECWCYKMCSQCVAKAGENGKIEAANRLKWCKQSRENAEEYIKNYIVLKNFGCKFEEGEA